MFFQFFSAFLFYYILFQYIFHHFPIYNGKIYTQPAQFVLNKMKRILQFQIQSETHERKHTTTQTTARYRENYYSHWKRKHGEKIMMKFVKIIPNLFSIIWWHFAIPKKFWHNTLWYCFPNFYLFFVNSLEELYHKSGTKFTWTVYSLQILPTVHYQNAAIN